MREFIKKIFNPEKITSEELLNKSVPYEDKGIKLEDEVNLFIKSDGTPVMTDRNTGKILYKWLGYNPRPEAVQALREKLGMIKKEEVPKEEVQKEKTPKKEVIFEKINLN